MTARRWRQVWWASLIGLALIGVVKVFVLHENVTLVASVIMCWGIAKWDFERDAKSRN